MFTDLFNCPKCEEPFDCKEGEPKIPGYDRKYGRSWCLACFANFTTLDRGLMDFLNQPAFKKVDGGYEYTLPINDPKCIACNGNTKVLIGKDATMIKCGHYICEACDNNRMWEALIISCSQCGVKSDKSTCVQLSAILMAFSSFLKGQRSGEAIGIQIGIQKGITADEAKKEEQRKHGAVKSCSDCGREQPVEHLFNCGDCKTVNCGSCTYISHHSHAVVKLLNIELVQMEQRNDKTYTENLQGLHGNLKHVQATIDEAVEKVLVAGKECLAEIPKRVKYDEALEIATAVEKAAEEFEKHCEEYIPVGRKLATRLTELSERLVQEKKN